MFDFTSIIAAIEGLRLALESNTLQAGQVINYQDYSFLMGLSGALSAFAFWMGLKR